MVDIYKHMIPPGETKKHRLFPVERDGKQLWVDITDMRKRKSNDSARLYRLEGETLIFDHFERVALLRKEGFY